MPTSTPPPFPTPPPHDRHPAPWEQIKPIPRKTHASEPTMIERVYKKPKPFKMPLYIKNTKPTNAVLKHLATSPRGDYGYNIRATLNFSHATIYNILHRLEGFGWIESWWAYGSSEDDKPFRRPRKYYELTPLGVTRVQERKLI